MAINKANVEPIIPPKDIWIGAKTAPVSIVMYGEYESEACEKANHVVNRLLEDYEGKVKFNFRHFPMMQVHQRSHKASEAAVGAAQEGRFWEMHNMLFEHRRNLGVISLKEYAKIIGVKDKNFLTKMVDAFYGWTVRADLLEALDKGIRDVPVFFINGVQFTEQPTYKNLTAEIDNSLRKAKRKQAARA